MMPIVKAMKTNPTTTLKAALIALALSATAHAGGPALLQLPVEGVTPKNSAQCEKLLEEKLGPSLSNWNNGAQGGDVQMLVKDSQNLIQLRPGRAPLSLADIETVLKGSPFSIKRDQLEFIGVMHVQVGKMNDHEKFAEQLAAIDGKNLMAYSEVTKDGNVMITLTLHNKGVTHKRLTSYLTENKVDLIAISWSGRFHCRAPFGARLVTEKVVSN